MAKLAEYDEISIEDHSDGQTLMDAIGCMEALLGFPIHESTSTDTTFDISGYEKSFWGNNKLKGYCKICIIDDHKLVITIPAGTDDLPLYHDVAIGFAFSSEYNSYQTENGFFMLGQTRKIILSYYWLMKYIDVKIDMYKEKEVDVVTAFINDEVLSSMKNTHKILTLMLIKSNLESLKCNVSTYE